MTTTRPPRAAAAPAPASAHPARTAPAAFALGVLAAQGLPAAAVAVAAFLGLAAAGLALAVLSRAITPAAAATVFLALGVGLAHGIVPPAAPPPSFLDRVVTARGVAGRTAIHVPARDGRPALRTTTLTDVEIATRSHAARLPRARLRLPDAASPPHRGERVRIAARVTSHRGRIALIPARDAPLVREDPGPLRAFRDLIAGMRGAATLRIETADPQRVDLVAALLLGEPLSDPELRDDVRAAGAAHLFVVSGFHLGLIALLVRRLARGLGFGPTLALAATGLCCALYAAIAGGAAPVLRALAMLALFHLGRALRRTPDVLTLLATCAAVSLALDRDLARDASFTLSFGALAGLIAIGAPARGTPVDPLQAFLERKLWRRRLRRAAVSQARASWGALAGAAAPSIAFFGSVAPLSLAASLALSPLVAVLLVLAMLLPLVPELAPLCDLVATPLVQGVALLAAPDLVARAPDGGRVVCAWAAALTALGAALALRRGGRRAWLFLPSAALVLVAAWPDAPAAGPRLVPDTRRGGPGAWRIETADALVLVRAGPARPRRADERGAALVFLPDPRAPAERPQIALPGGTQVAAAGALTWRGTKLTVTALGGGAHALEVEAGAGRVLVATATAPAALDAIVARRRPRVLGLDGAVTPGRAQALLAAGAADLVTPRRDDPGLARVRARWCPAPE